MSNKETDFIPWIEKYRPKKLSQVIGHSHIVKRLEAFVKSKNIPHLMLCGPAGVGKTSALLAMARELFGENLRESFLELNASVTPETPVLIRLNGVVQRTNFAFLASKFFKGAEKRVLTSGLEVLSLDKDLKNRFLPVNYLFRQSYFEQSLE